MTAKEGWTQLPTTGSQAGRAWPNLPSVPLMVYTEESSNFVVINTTERQRLLNRTSKATSMTRTFCTRITNLLEIKAAEKRKKKKRLLEY